LEHFSLRQLNLRDHFSQTLSLRFRRYLAFASILCCIATGSVWLRGGVTAVAGQKSPASVDGPEPWTPAQTVEPAKLAKELSSSSKPVVVCVGFHTLYEGAHIPGSSFHGPASTSDGLADLRKWARLQPRSANIVVYCGCCPLSRCPNARPAFQALRDMGFTRVRLLLIPKDFASNWVDAGYPVAKGK
jgi:rhodanese-related sulfurtransferase